MNKKEKVNLEMVSKSWASAPVSRSPADTQWPEAHLQLGAGHQLPGHFGPALWLSEENGEGLLNGQEGGACKAGSSFYTQARG